MSTTTDGNRPWARRLHWRRVEDAALTECGSRALRSTPSRFELLRVAERDESDVCSRCLARVLA